MPHYLRHIRQRRRPIRHDAAAEMLMASYASRVAADKIRYAADTPHIRDDYAAITSYCRYCYILILRYMPPLFITPHYIDY